jgi:hypothetical protein
MYSLYGVTYVCIYRRWEGKRNKEYWDRSECRVPSWALTGGHFVVSKRRLAVTLCRGATPQPKGRYPLQIDPRHCPDCLAVVTEPTTAARSIQVSTQVQGWIYGTLPPMHHTCSRRGAVVPSLPIAHIRAALNKTEHRRWQQGGRGAS